MTPSSAVRYGYRGTELLRRPGLERFAGTGFTRPTGPVGCATFLGRPAWTVELAPSQDKPYPVQLVVDAETGLLLQQRNDGFATVHEWVEIVTGETFDESLFRWEGEVRDWQDEQSTEHATELREHEADLAVSRAWAEQNVLPGPLRVEVELDLQIHVYDETGAFEASLGAGFQGMLARRPRSAAEWELGWNVIQRRWSDDRWDWAFSAGDNPLAPGAFDAVRRQLDS